MSGIPMLLAITSTSGAGAGLLGIAATRRCDPTRPAQCACLLLGVAIAIIAAAAAWGFGSLPLAAWAVPMAVLAMLDMHLTRLPHPVTAMSAIAVLLAAFIAYSEPGLDGSSAMLFGVFLGITLTGLAVPWLSETPNSIGWEMLSYLALATPLLALMFTEIPPLIVATAAIGLGFAVLLLVAGRLYDASRSSSTDEGRGAEGSTSEQMPSAGGGDPTFIAVWAMVTGLLGVEIGSHVPAETLPFGAAYNHAFKTLTVTFWLTFLVMIFLLVHKGRDRGSSPAEALEGQVVILHERSLRAFLLDGVNLGVALPVGLCLSLPVLLLI